jgi:aryl-alcohol dehydrogenase-like predicted oxidoreductase
LRGAPKEESKKIFDLYVDSGGNFIDTANIYQNGSSEKYVGELISTEREVKHYIYRSFMGPRMGLYDTYRRANAFPRRLD